MRKDSCLLYTNRALTLLNLGLYTRAGEDCDWALKLNDDSLKARLYKGRALFEQGEDELSKEIMDEAKQKFPDKLDVIEGINVMRRQCRRIIQFLLPTFSLFNLFQYTGLTICLCRKQIIARPTI